MEYTFGYDIENVLQVQDYVELNYEKDYYKMSRGYGDDCINYLKLYTEEQDVVLDELIEACDGEGKFEE